jgi:hypothetical protein
MGTITRHRAYQTNGPTKHQVREEYPSLIDKPMDQILTFCVQAALNRLRQLSLD